MWPWWKEICEEVELYNGVNEFLTRIEIMSISETAVVGSRLFSQSVGQLGSQTTSKPVSKSLSQFVSQSVNRSCDREIMQRQRKRKKLKGKTNK